MAKSSMTSPFRLPSHGGGRAAPSNVNSESSKDAPRKGRKPDKFNDKSDSDVLSVSSSSSSSDSDTDSDSEPDTANGRMRKQRRLKEKAREYTRTSKQKAQQKADKKFHYPHLTRAPNQPRPDQPANSSLHARATWLHQAYKYQTDKQPFKISSTPRYASTFLVVSQTLARGSNQAAGIDA